MTRIQPIETTYAGCRFRSRLEARWAMVFDALRLPWQYEPQGYVLDGEPYLPDFWLPTLDSYVEIKGVSPNDREVRVAEGLAKGTGKRVLIAWGDIPRGDGSDTTDSMLAIMPFTYPDGTADVGGDESYGLCRCPGCGCIGIEFNATHVGRIECPHHDTDTRVRCDVEEVVDTDERIVAAYAAARSARFDGGSR